MQSFSMPLPNAHDMQLCKGLQSLTATNSIVEYTQRRLDVSQIK